MKKETIMAIILGVVTGSVIAASLIFVSRKQEVKNNKVIAPKTTPTVAPDQKNAQKLEIQKPTNEFVSLTNELVIEGKAQKDALIVVQTPSSEKVVKVEKDAFRIAIPLTLGQNKIKVTSYLKNTSEEKNLTIYYIKE